MLKFKHYLSIFLVLLSSLAMAQGRTVTGSVSGPGNIPLPGVTVSQKGTKNAAVTNDAGIFSIKVTGTNVVLVMSSIGFASQEVSVPEGTNSIVVSLADASKQLGEVVVTALGVTKSKRNLNYATQTVDTKDLTKARENNLANSLSGKVAGLDVVRSSQGVGSTVRVVLRGDRSFQGNSEALIIIDGIPGGDLGTINPDDIVSMNVLKGSSASALYGSDAQNGAIIVTTKKGSAAKGIAIGINSSYQADKPVNLRDFQNEYAQGSEGQYLKVAEGTWGPKITGQTVENWSLDPADEETYQLKAHPDNYQNFFSTGSTFTNGFSLSGGGEKVQAFFSYNNVNGKGIVDNNLFNRHNFNFRVGGNITEKLSFDTKITYFQQKATNYVRSDEDFANVNRQIIRLPTNIDVDYAASHYQYYNEERELKQNYWNPGSNGGENPYWVKNNTSNFFDASQVKGMGSLTYRFMPNLSLMFRTGINKNTNLSQDRRFFDTYVIANSGYFGMNTNSFQEINNELLLSYSENFGDFNLSANAGGNMKQRKYNELNTFASELVNENVFTFNNAASGKLSSNEGFWEYKKNSVYASADLGFRKSLILSVTGRNDWSSSLPKDNWSFFYGSAGLTAIISDMVKLPEAINLFKLRASIAQTGNDPGPYQTKEYYSITPGGGIAKSQVKPADTLKPEITTGQEYGFDLGMFDNRLGLEFTYYKTNSKNQLVSVRTPPASGYSSKFINAGNVQNSGIEVTLNFIPIRTKDFTWSAYINYAKNENKVIEIAPNSPEFTLRGDFINQTKIIEGRPYGEMYSRGFVRNTAGQIIVKDGIPQVTGAQTVYLGNSRPDWNGGFGNRFTYKDFSLSFLITARMGGRITSFTDAVIDGDGLTGKTLAGRDGFIVDGVNEDGSKNTTSIPAQKYWTALGGRNTPAGEVFTYDASNIRLRELVFTYTIPQRSIEKTKLKGATVSLTGRNLFFFKNSAGGFDPELVVSTDKGSIGTESFCLPYSRTIGINLSLNF
ncbi:SusC/RagA family TonB-linked outer membrane protein [Flavihumibacter fluvii]|uniref:SusC/RagA family TonB-linked outer membrane protein n=1 Tax=Flavihumibacter fluvii TaxID=2838157 RepID=UPI001BDF07C0|nr:SusC/RagA family TonB-linked outer membrane protein [Flavihumibacter fluvii]ULQ51423.1 SusC/RagA family TonB-linked outer membrane protein [Flavihumibacter fluvii]